jgi:hypothetical protein
MTVDEPLATIGDALSLPPMLEHRRREIEATLRPTSNPRRGRAAENLLSARTWRFTREHLPWLRAVRARV